MDKTEAKSVLEGAASEIGLVKLSVARAGPNGGARGDEIEVTLIEAARMNAAGQLVIPAGDEGERMRAAFGVIIEAEAAMAVKDDPVETSVKVKAAKSKPADNAAKGNAPENAAKGGQ